MHQHCDADLLHMLTTSVPPANIEAIGLFKSKLAKYQQEAKPRCFSVRKTVNILSHISGALPEWKVQKEKTDKAAELPACKKLDAKNRWKSNGIWAYRNFQFLRLQAQLLQTTWSQTELKIQNDLILLREWASFSSLQNNRLNMSIFDSPIFWYFIFQLLLRYNSSLRADWTCSTWPKDLQMAKRGCRKWWLIHTWPYATKRSRGRMELWLRNRLPWGLLRFSTDPLKVMPISTSVDALQFFFHFESPGSPLWLLIARFGRVVFWLHFYMSFFDL